MREGWQKVPLGKVATLDLDRVAVADGRSYPVAGVLNAGKGLFSRERINGSITNYPMLYRLHTDQLVMRKLTAWEGPITTVDEEYDGYFVSPEFPTFTLDRRFLEPSYMRLICQAPELWEAMKNTSTGTVQRRKRVSPSALLSIELDLPPLQEQRWIVDLISVCDDFADKVSRHEIACRDAETSLRTSLFQPGLCTVVPLVELCAPGGIQIGPFGSQLHASDYVQVGIPTVMPKDIRDGSGTRRHDRESIRSRLETPGAASPTGR